MLTRAPNKSTSPIKQSDAIATTCSSPAKAGYPVRRGFLARSLPSLEYWVTRPSAQLRTRRVTTTEYGIRDLCDMF